MSRPTEAQQADLRAARVQRRLCEWKATEAYGKGCGAGKVSATAWRMHPLHGDERSGGTLQYAILELAEQLAKAGDDEVARAFARGAIVGFCCSIEFPDAAEVEACAAIRRAAWWPGSHRRVWGGQ